MSAAIEVTHLVKRFNGLTAVDDISLAVEPGEIFGEMAPISEMPRSATAVAKTACRVLSMGITQFNESLSRTPVFALMLMSIMINRLRLTDARLSMRHALPTAERHVGRVFEEAVLADLQREARSVVRLRYLAGKAILVRIVSMLVGLIRSTSASRVYENTTREDLGLCTRFFLSVQ